MTTQYKRALALLSVIAALIAGGFFSTTDGDEKLKQIEAILYTPTGIAPSLTPSPRPSATNTLHSIFGTATDLAKSPTIENASPLSFYVTEQGGLAGYRCTSNRFIISSCARQLTGLSYHVSYTLALNDIFCMYDGKWYRLKSTSGLWFAWRNFDGSIDYGDINTGLTDQEFVGIYCI